MSARVISWKSNIVSLNSRPILPYQAPFLLSFSDASNVGCGAYLVGANENSYRMWSPCEAAKSSTWRELKAVHFTLTSFKELVEGKSVKWHSDNQGAVRIVDIGSPNSELHSIALDIFHNGFLGSLMLVLMKLAMSWISMTGVQPRVFFCTLR